ncbi:ABC transporter ATP-binding protein [Brachybacterium alimentarium]|uniref:ABC transporter ATP-binding protein n=1 Tax=Brachybacterium alimentarium TaxID=47845 RepID=UPI000BB684C2|nr:ABC transporter ATP-binding protein [Brachybacterium alimentarium]PCC31171.1 ABC transporter ATP-binding protein [Brachybacterium alimentarium]RCS71215.1 ABC transporter ATP-binding protein [Brachybacterium alimentarium]RCS84367.1 ABC transporter ATP-binding protein [Brachybacterium alimentarium]RCS93037.1 ABC transporter ATP-binding protein [Brachybacterium alimentarium]
MNTSTAPATPATPAATSAPGPVPAPTSAPAAPAISLRGLTRTYGSVRALDGLDLEIGRGEIVALLGPNGAGKSTAMEMMVGLAAPDAGEARILGADPVEATRTGLIGTMLQSGPLLPDQSVRSMLRLLHSLQAHPMPLADAARQADVTELLPRRIGTLSGGQAQRVRFAIALLGDPQVLLLDEPTVGMDIGARRAFWDQMRAVAATGRTIVFATHHLDEAEREARRVIVMDRGRVVADGTGPEISAIVGGRVITLRGVDADEIVALPGVQSAGADETDPGRVRALCSDSDAALAALFTGDLAGRVREVLVSAPGLEEAFLRITDHSVPRDPADAAAPDAEEGTRP